MPPFLINHKLNFLLRLIILTFLIQLPTCAATTDTNIQHEDKPMSWNKSYQEGLAYELYFRNLARMGFAKHLNDTNDIYETETWAIYAKLEDISTTVMAPLRKKYQIDTTVKMSARIGAWAIAKGMAWLPLQTTSAAEESAQRFIVDLQAIQALGPAEDQLQLQFMVDHEIVLADFLKLYSLGRKQEAKEVFEKAFIEYHQAFSTTP